MSDEYAARLTIGMLDHLTTKENVTKAEALRDKLKNAALDTVGGRILQARDAAENLNFQSVTLNSNDPRVPSVIDIDALVRLLVGSEDE